MIEPPDFLIVGTPRSGTTLVQRLACELPGVRVPPETHFFSLFASELAARRRFPIRGRELGAELACYASMAETKDLDLDLDEAMRLLNGQCLGVGHFFSAIVRALVGRDTVLCGEKTPDHLLWWRPLTRCFGKLKLVAVVRDPRAVVASSLEVPFGMRHPLLLAERWAADQRQLADALHVLGAERLLVLRYEDVVADPTAAKLRIRAHLGTESATSAEAAKSGLTKRLFVEREVWKHRVTEDVTTGRVAAWREALAPPAHARISVICRREMSRWGYAESEQGSPGSRRIRVHPQPTIELKRLYFRLARRQQMWRINRTPL